MTRQKKTPAQRAQDALDVANRAVVRLDKKLDGLKAELAAVEREHAAAVARQQYLRQHPDLSEAARQAAAAFDNASTS